MKRLLMLNVGLLLAGCASEPEFPAGPPLGAEQARHLLVRTGFNALPDEIRNFAKLDANQAVDRLLQHTQSHATTPLPAWTALLPDRQPKRELTAEERQEQNRLFRERGNELRAWWYQEMLSTPTPLTERMTLFWHNHFTSSVEKVRVTQLMATQNQTLRQYALGNFGDLLLAMAKDPAMLVYLDGARNVAGQPNENFAREVMELFSLGEGHYSEQDVREAARAFTGWSVDQETGQFINRPRQHDNGQKTIFGQTGNFDGQDVIRLILARPQTSEFIANKLWREFISPEPDQAEVTRLAKLFRDRHYEIKPLMQALLTSPAFYALESRGQLVKSPVELVVGTLREFHQAPSDWQPFLFSAKQMGQDIFAPPNVKGWPSGDWWINSQTLSVRQQFISRLMRGDGRGARGQREPDYAAWMTGCGNSPVCASAALLAQAPPTLPQGAPATVIRALVADLRYQLK